MPERCPISLNKRGVKIQATFRIISLRLSRNRALQQVIPLYSKCMRQEIIFWIGSFPCYALPIHPIVCLSSPNNISMWCQLKLGSYRSIVIRDDIITCLGIETAYSLSNTNLYRITTATYFLQQLSHGSAVEIMISELKKSLPGWIPSLCQRY